MSVVVVDEPLQHELELLTAPVELRDRQGRLLGRFSPVLSGRQVRRASDNCPYSDDELDAMRNETGGRTLTEIKRVWVGA
jgi:hypothetical protein